MPILESVRHERFARYLAEGKSQVESYELAGYEPHESNPARLSANERVQARVAELRATAAEAAQVDLAWIAQMAKRNAERSMQAVPVLDRDGNETGEYQYQGSVTNGALKLLHEMLAPQVQQPVVRAEIKLQLSNATAVLDEAEERDLTDEARS